MSAATEGYFVSRTLHALEALATRPLSSTELAEVIGVHPRTARRLLMRLAHEAYAAPLGGRHHRYAATLRLPALGARALLGELQPVPGESSQQETGVELTLARRSHTEFGGRAAVQPTARRVA